MHLIAFFKVSDFFGKAATSLAIFFSWSKLSYPLIRSISETDENPVALAACTSWPVGWWPLFFLKPCYSVRPAQSLAIPININPNQNNYAIAHLHA